MAFVYLFFSTVMQTSFKILVIEYYSDLRHTLQNCIKSHIWSFLIHLGDHPRCVSVCLFSGIYSIFAFTFFIFNSHLLLQWTRFESETKTDNLKAFPLKRCEGIKISTSKCQRYTLNNTGQHDRACTYARLANVAVPKTKILQLKRLRCLTCC